MTKVGLRKLEFGYSLKKKFPFEKYIYKININFKNHIPKSNILDPLEITMDQDPNPLT